MSAAVYFWNNGEVIEATDTSENRKKYHMLYCVDTAHDLDDPAMRYGRYDHRGWHHVPLVTFPSEFRAHLLLLGVA